MIGAFINYVIRQVVVLKFAFEWNEKSQQAGGKKWKKKYRMAMFSERHATEITQIKNTFLGREVQRRIDRLRSRFIKRHEKVVTARNHVLRLYRTVSSDLNSCIAHLRHLSTVWIRCFLGSHMGD